MTRDRDLKQQVRRRMAWTGERYTVARQALIGPPPRRGSAIDPKGTVEMSTEVPLTIQLMTDTDGERAAEKRLRQVLRRWRLDQFIFFEQVRLDATTDLPVSFPIPTFPPSALASGEDVGALVVFLHAQMHWALNELSGGEAAVEEIAQQHPDAVRDGSALPCATGDGAAHAVVCLLEQDALAGLVGADAAHEALASRHEYLNPLRLLPTGAALVGFRDRHELALPTTPPYLERRRPIDLRPEGPVVILAMGQRQEWDLAERLRAAHLRHDLRRWRFSPQVAIQSVGPPRFDGAVPAMSALDATVPDTDLVLRYVELQGAWWSSQHSSVVLEHHLASPLRAAGRDPDRPGSLQEAFGCAVALDAAHRIFDDALIGAAIARHPRNSAVYRAVDHHDLLLDRLSQDGIPVTVPDGHL